MAVSILGIGSVCALGRGIEPLREGLRGAAAPRPETVEIATAQGPISLDAFTAHAEGLEQYVPARSLRRMDNIARMALMASHQALEDAGLDVRDKSRIGVVFGSGHGPQKTAFAFIDGLIDDGDSLASPMLFAGSVHNSLASLVSIAMKIQGPCQTLTCFEMTPAAVFDVAEQWLATGMADFVLAGVGDERCGVADYAAALSQPKFVPGEGFVAFALGPGSGPGKYGAIQEIRMGRGADSLAEQVGLDLDAVLLSDCPYRQPGGAGQLAAPHSAPAVYCAPLYGSMPTAQGFDIALAALSLERGELRPCGGKPEGLKANWLKEPLALGGGGVLGCLSLGRDENFSLATVSKARG